MIAFGPPAPHCRAALLRNCPRPDLLVCFWAAVRGRGEEVGVRAAAGPFTPQGGGLIRELLRPGTGRLRGRLEGRVLWKMRQGKREIS